MPNHAEDLIRRTGDRVTLSRIKVLDFLLSQQRAVTHHQIEHELGGTEAMDRVTLYRVLDWLSKKGLAHKFISGDRVWRFRANNENTHLHLHQHAHFKCTECSEVICLNDVIMGDVPLPIGYRAVQTELTVKGLCAQCS